MHDEVSETENIRKNLAIERMIIEGCDILLDTSQVFVRQGRIICIEKLHHRIYMSSSDRKPCLWVRFVIKSCCFGYWKFIASPTWSLFYLWYTMLGICLYCLSSWIVWKFLLAKISVSRILYLMLIMKAVIIEALQYTLDFSICTNLLTFHGRYAVTSWQWQEEWRIETRKFQLNIQGQRSTKKGVPLYSSPADSNSAVQWTTTSSQGTMNATIYLRVFPMYLITKMCLCQGG